MLQASLYIPGYEQEQAQQLLQGASWVPPTIRPFFLDQAQQPASGEPAPEASSASGVGAAAEPSGSVAGSIAQEASRASAVGASMEGMDITFAGGVMEGADAVIGEGAVINEEQALKVQQLDERLPTPQATPPELHGQLAQSTSAADVAGLLSSAASKAAEAVADEDLAEEESSVQAEITRASAGGDSNVSPEPSKAPEPAPEVSTESSSPFKSKWKPLPRPPAPVLPPPSQPSPAQLAHQAVSKVLQDLLADILDPAKEPDVLAAVNVLAKEEVPAFVEIRSEIPPVFVIGGKAAEVQAEASAAALAQAAAQAEATEGAGSNLAPSRDESEAHASTSGAGSAWRRSNAGSIRGESSHWSSQPSQWPARQSAGGSSDWGSVAEGHGRVAEEEEEQARQKEEEEAIQALMHDKEFQVFAEYVLESAILGLVQESVAGDWEMPGSSSK